MFSLFKLQLYFFLEAGHPNRKRSLLLWTPWRCRGTVGFHTILPHKLVFCRSDTASCSTIQRDRAYLLVAAAHPVFDFFGFLNGFQHFHCVQLLLCRRFTVKTNLNMETRDEKMCHTVWQKAARVNSINSNSWSSINSGRSTCSNSNITKEAVWWCWLFICAVLVVAVQ